MCGRFTLVSSGEDVAELFGLSEIPNLDERYNIAPTQPIPVIVSDGNPSTSRLTEMRWGLIPSWANDPTIGSRMINARAETIVEKPAFRSAFKQRRCLVVADGFYEWQKNGPLKQAYHIRLEDGGPFAFAGLWEHWGDAGASGINSCTIITTEPNMLMADIHDRMPVILDPKDFSTWLDPSAVQKLRTLLKPFPSERMSCCAVSARVNNPLNDTRECVLPLAEV